ncbi:MAG: plastocyanin/azurin family copper-binding protein [Candidatus Nitrosocosmicus sp.]|nr:plastocyanin/azurin family copper-binding protein [Candidatus Nitrosocosmicus sp.]
MLYYHDFGIVIVLFSIIIIIIVQSPIDFGNIQYLSYGQEGTSSVNHTVTIAKGSANPEVDITNLAPKKWYDPREISIKVNNTIKWINDDTEPHTVTSGIGGGLNSLISNSQGKPNGLFDSGLFGPGKSISMKFNQSGTFPYFCTIHPWMEGVVRVSNPNINIPSYPVDESGNKIDDFPIYNFTDDRKVEVGMSWSPSSIVTNEPIHFIMEFFKFPENTKMHLWPYNFVILQNNSELFRTSGITQVGSSAQTFAFNSTGPTIIKVESADNPSSFVQFGTIVYKNPYKTTTEFQNVSNSFFLLSPLTLVYLVYAIIIVLPLALVALIILYKKKKI